MKFYFDSIMISISDIWLWSLIRSDAFWYAVIKIYFCH